MRANGPPCRKRLIQNQKRPLVRSSETTDADRLLERKREREEQCRWQRRTLPRGRPRSTIRAGELNCRVRDGAGWTLTALATNNCRSPLFLTSLLYRCRSRFASHTLAYSRFQVPSSPNDRGQASTVSTGWLRTLLRFHLPPIKLVVFQRSYLVIQWGVSSRGRFPA